MIRASLGVLPGMGARLVVPSMTVCVGRRMCSTTPQSPPPPTATPEVAILEVWEHFKQFSTADGGDNVTVRIQCPNSTLTHLNETVRHRHYPLQRAFAHLPPHSAKQAVERGWIVGSLKDVPGGSRRVLIEAFLKEGWGIQSHNVTLSEREWLIQTTLFTRK
jgi:hypothetical protein